MVGIFMLALAYILSQFYRSFLAVLTPSLASEIGATKADLSLASGAWFIAFALMQFIVGVSLDRYGPKRTVTILLSVFGAGGAALFALASEPWMIVAAMVMIGVGCSPILMASLYIFAKVFPPKRFAVLASWIVAIGMLGNVIGASPLANAAEAFGWRNVMMSLGGFTLLTAILLFATIKDPDRADDAEQEGLGFSGYLELMRLSALWFLLPIILVNYVAAAGIRGLWAGPYLTDVFGADALTIGSVTLYMALAMVAGSFLYGPLDTIFQTRKWIVVVGNTICGAACLWLALNVSSSIITATVAFVIIGISGSSFAQLMAHGRSFFPQRLIGRGVTLLNFFGIGGVGLMQVVTGWIVTTNADPLAPSTSYSALFFFYAAILAMALSIYLFSRDMKPGAA